MEVFTFLGTLMSIIGGGISITDTIGKVVKAVKSKRSFDDEIRKALEKVTDDDFQRRRLITLSSDILHFAVRKLNNEKIILPPDIDENEFNDFYDRMLSNKETCLFLQTQLQNYKIDKLSQKLDDIYAAIKISGLRSYENVLDVHVKRRFLDEASENLIKEKKLYFNKHYINKVKNCMDDRKDCLIKAPEGRGKTYLSRIIAYEYHHEHRMEVWFLDFKDENDENSKISIENLDDQLKAWHEFKEKNYLLVLENVHAYSDVNGLQKKINDWIDTTDNHIRFLLNARPTDEGLVDFSGWEDTMVELKPNETDINAIIDLYSEEIHRPPFENQEERGSFLKRVYPEGNNSIGANLRLLNIYLKTWQNHPEKTYISDIDEPTILKDFIKHYKLETVKDDDINVLHYISCIYQFDVPLHRDLIPKDSSSSLLKFKRKGLLRKVNSTYHLPHSVDALYLSKAISLYDDEENYVYEYLENTKLFVNRFINAILANSNPRKFEGEFKLLIQGLIQRKKEFQMLINELADWPMAERIIKNINPGFIIIAFNPQNGHSSQERLEYYKANLDWLKTFIFEINPSSLNYLCANFKRYLKHNIFEDFFKNPEELNDYLKNNERVFYQNHILEAIGGMREEYKQTLIDYYKQNIDRLKPYFLGLGSTNLNFIYRSFNRFFKSDLNVFKDIFKDPNDLYDYLRINFKLFRQSEFLKVFGGMGEEYKQVLIDYYKQDIDRLKPYSLELHPATLVSIYRFFKSGLGLNIFKDFFKNPKDLNDYLRDHENVFYNNHILEAISDVGEEHKRVLKDYYEQNIDRLKPSFLKLNPINLTFVYKTFKKPLDYNIVKDIFTNPNDFDEYLKNNNHKVLMQYDGIIKAIRDLGEEYRLIHKSFMVRNGYDYFFYSRKRSFCISQYNIDFHWNSKKPYDVSQIKEDDFMFYEVHWEGMGRFVKIISYNMNDDNRNHSINIVKAIIQIVLNSKESLPHASAQNLSLFYASIASVDKNLFENLINEKFVIKDLKYRLSRKKYSLDDLRLFSLFYNEKWFYRDMVKIVNRTLDSLNEADEKDLSMLLGNLKYNNDDFYKDLITKEIVVDIAKKRFETFTLGYDNLWDNLYLFGNFYSQDWCKDEMNSLINNADEEQQKVIKEWHDKVMKGLIEGGKTLDIGTLWDYIHNKFFSEQQNN